MVMNRHATFTLWVGALMLTGCAAQEPNQSARRPVDFFEIGRLSDISEPQTELVTTKFRLLERAEVCSDMGLSHEQSNTVRRVYETPWEQIPGLTEFRAQQKPTRQEAGLTEDKQVSLNLASSRGRGRIIAQFRTQQLQVTLSPQQAERLEQLLLQTRGPLMLVIDTNLAATLRLSPEQMQRIRDVVRQADEEVTPVLQKFGRGFWAGYSSNETADTRTGEMNALIPRLRQMIEERDEKILRVITADQVSKLKAREGRPLPIQWDPWQFMAQPFEKTNS
jgi:hypothetical protein